MTNYTIRPMTAVDIPIGMALKQIAGWNQTLRDWHMLLKVSQGGCYVAEVKGKPVGTITTVSYPPHFSWIGMLLVQPEYRRKGIGTALLKSAISFAEEIGAVRLDARPAGKPLYLDMGFIEEYNLVRMVRPGNAVPVEPVPSTLHLDADAIHDLSTYDRSIFGAERHKILLYLYDAAPQYGFYTLSELKTMDHSNINGYCLGRSGSRYDQIGPIVADDPDTAHNLLTAALNACGQKQVIIDVPTANTDWMQELHQLGFNTIVEYTRMILGSHQTIGQPEKQYAIAGPEIG